MARRVIAFLLALGAVLAVDVVWQMREQNLAVQAAVVFSPEVAGRTIVVPRSPSPAELRAAEMLQSGLAKAAGRPLAAFPVVTEAVGAPRAAIRVGATEHGRGPVGRPAPAHFDSGVTCEVWAGSVGLRSERRESIEMAAAWFLEKELGAHWFMPGSLGEVIPARASLVLPAGRQEARPGFVSRDLGGIDEPVGREWSARNRLERRIEHGHHLASIFPREVLQKDPTMAPLRAGVRHVPPPGSANYQPDLTSPSAINHAAETARRAFARESGRAVFSLGVNDSLRFDESPATFAAVSPPRFFRGRPDYSDLVFGFANAVAQRVRPEFPDRWISSYAYYWAENTPRFKVEPNVLPMLTADRAQWFDPAAAEEDRQLITRWTRSGAGLVGSYDYFYGAPFLVPRPTLYAVREAIPFQYEAGVRAFYAETNPNWALDGPKPWLSAQLLWSPKADPAKLLQTYFEGFWRESAAPMRDFFELCEQVWLGQPRPGYWIKFFRDEHQAGLFPAEVRQKLRRCVEAAGQQARTDEVRACVAFVAAGLSVAEAFCEMVETRTRLGLLAAQREAEPAALATAWRAAAGARQEFEQRTAQVRLHHPLAMAPQDTTKYLRTDPAARVVRRLLETERGRAVLAQQSDLALQTWGATPGEMAVMTTAGRELLVDAGWSDLSVGALSGSTDFDWTAAGSPWRGNGEPHEGRTVQLLAARSGTAGPAATSATLRFQNCLLESLGQWVATSEGMLHEARVKVRARVSPGNGTYLILGFLDEKHRYFGTGRIDRLPASTEIQELELSVAGIAPVGARYVGFGLCVTNQVNEDFAEFRAASLKQWDPSRK